MGKEQKQAFELLKQKIAEVTNLTVFNPKLPILLACDASEMGMGAVLLQKWPDGTERPICHASKTLTPQQRKYSQLEKEGLSIIFGIKKFNNYLFGGEFTILTDNKALVSLFSSSKQFPILASRRIQRWSLYLMEYNYTVEFKPTKLHLNADALSRLPIKDDTMELSDYLECNYFDLIQFPIAHSKVASETRNDPISNSVMKFIDSGWPSRSSLQKEMLWYYSNRKNLFTKRGVLYLESECDRVVIPKSLRKKLLTLLHVGHWGSTRMKQLARRYCIWEDINRDIENFVEVCTPCQEYARSPDKNDSSWPETREPWNRLHIDFAGPFFGCIWMLMIDSYSKFPYVLRMDSTDSKNTIKAMFGVFSVEGFPKNIVTDNGPQFISKDFKDFCERFQINHVTSAPFHPQSNGEVERFVQTIH